MTKWLTTGEMIEALKKEQLAINEWDCKITKDAYNSIPQVIDVEGVAERYEFLPLKSEFVNCKWRILPNYVSFEEAMKALKEGKSVYFHGNNSITSPIKCPVHGANLNGSSLIEYGLASLYEGKWTIEGDNQ